MTNIYILKVAAIQYNPCCKNSEIGLDIEHKQPIYKYIHRCTKCGREIKRQKQSKVILNYKKYRCGKCGGGLKRVY